MDRAIIYDQAQGRDYDVLHGWRKALYSLGQATLDLLGSSSTVIAGFAATPTGPLSLTINIAQGDIYSFQEVDATAYGSLAADTTNTIQQGYAAAQTVTLSTSGLSTGQSRYALVQCQWQQVDDIPSDDPTGGLLAYLNTSNPSGPPWSGPGNDGLAQNTRRKGVATISVIYGTVATTGSEVPPNPSANCVPLYLVDLAFGQTTISAGQILTAGPSVGTGVPNNYPYAPFLAGLLNSHHSGTTGQAPKIKLTGGQEVQGILPSSMVDPNQSGNYAADTSVTANVVTATFTPAITANVHGLPLRVKVANNSVAGAATFNPGPGAIQLVRPSDNSGPVILAANDLIAGNIYTFVYNDTVAGYEVLELTWATAFGQQLLAGVALGNAGANVQVWPAQNGLVRVWFDDGAGNTYAALVNHYKNATSYTPSCVTTTGAPGTMTFSSNVSGFLQVSRSGGPASVTLNARVLQAL